MRSTRMRRTVGLEPTQMSSLAGFLAAEHVGRFRRMDGDYEKSVKLSDINVTVGALSD